jgi:hypothetical protein
MSARKKDKVIIQLKRPYALLMMSAALFVGAGWMEIHQAETNDRGLIINGIITLGPHGADVFYAVMGTFGLAFGALFVVALAGLASRREFRIVLGKNAVSMPHSQLWRTQDLTIPYATILSVGSEPAGKPSLVRIQTKTGPHRMSLRFLPSDWQAQAVAKVLVERWRQWHANTQERAGKARDDVDVQPPARVTCPECKRSNDGDAAFCAGCGERISG